MRSVANRHKVGRADLARGFSLAELLIVIGIIALLISILLPPLQLAKRQTMQTTCASQLGQLSTALNQTRTEYRDFYPVWDDGGSPVRYTWVDVLIQRSQISERKLGYCPVDRRPDPLSEARAAHFGVRYPGRPDRFGIDYSYGISVPLSAGAWAWRPGFGRGDDQRPRRLVFGRGSAAYRVLAADSTWSAIYNLSGDATDSNDWSSPSQYDNMVAWRHADRVANIAFQDGHVGAVRYDARAAEPVSTSKQYVWYPGESIYVGPEDSFEGNYYPDAPPFLNQSGLIADGFPRELVPQYYTQNHLWTQILHK